MRTKIISFTGILFDVFRLTVFCKKKTIKIVFYVLYADYGKIFCNEFIIWFYKEPLMNNPINLLIVELCCTENTLVNVNLPLWMKLDSSLPLKSPVILALYSTLILPYCDSVLTMY